METLQRAKQTPLHKLQRTQAFLLDFAKATVLFESQMRFMNDVSCPPRTASCFNPSSKHFLTSFGKPLGLHLDFQNQSEHDQNRRSKNDQSGYPPGAVRGGSALYRGIPPIWACWGRPRGVITRGVIVVAFWNQKTIFQLNSNPPWSNPS